MSRSPRLQRDDGQRRLRHRWKSAMISLSRAVPPFPFDPRLFVERFRHWWSSADDSRVSARRVHVVLDQTRFEILRISLLGPRPSVPVRGSGGIDPHLLLTRQALQLWEALFSRWEMGWSRSYSLMSPSWSAVSSFLPLSLAELLKTPGTTQSPIRSSCPLIWSPSLVDTPLAAVCPLSLQVPTLLDLLLRLRVPLLAR